MRRWATPERPLLGHADDDRHGRKAKRWSSGRKKSKVVGGLVLTLLGLSLVFFYTTQVHIEIAAYSRRWIEKEVVEIRQLSPPGVCFPSKGYNQSLADSPKKLLLHAGISLKRRADCYSFAGLIPREPFPEQILPEHTIFHTYWRADLQPFAERQLVTIESILNTQPFDVTSVILWTNNQPKLAAHPPLQQLSQKHSRFSIRQIDLSNLAADTPLDNSKMLAKAIDPKAWLDGDLARILLLWKFGGVWVDMDTLLTRSLLPLLESEWVTQWDCYDKPYYPLNGALMHFYAQSPYLCEMMHIMATESLPRQGTVDWGSFLYHKVWRGLVAAGHRPFAVLPWCFADGRSCRLDNRLPDPFQSDPKYSNSRWQQLDKQLDYISSQFTYTTNGQKAFRAMAGSVA